MTTKSYLGWIIDPTSTGDAAVDQRIVDALREAYPAASILAPYPGSLGQEYPVLIGAPTHPRSQNPRWDMEIAIEETRAENIIAAVRLA